MTIQRDDAGCSGVTEPGAQFGTTNPEPGRTDAPVLSIYPREPGYCCDMLINDARGKPIPCPNGCGETLDYEPPRKAEDDTGPPAYRGGYYCDICVMDFERSEPDTD